jgi:hypothetical protein
LLTRNQSVGRNDVPKARFTSLQYQLKALIELGDEPKSVLEIGPGRGYFRVMGELLGYDVSTLDLDPENQPDYDCDIAELDMAGGFNVVCAFEVLEHMPYESSLKMFTEMLRLSSKWVVVSVPIKRNTWSLRVQIPERFIRRRFGTTWLRGGKYFSIRTELPKRSDLSLPEEGNWKPHHWELGRSSYPTGRLVRDLSNLGATLVQQFTNPSHDYHEYFVFEKK